MLVTAMRELIPPRIAHRTRKNKTLRRTKKTLKIRKNSNLNKIETSTKKGLSNKWITNIKTKIDTQQSVIMGMNSKRKPLKYYIIIMEYIYM